MYTYNFWSIIIFVWGEISYYENLKSKESVTSYCIKIILYVKSLRIIFLLSYLIPDEKNNISDDNR